MNTDNRSAQEGHAGFDSAGVRDGLHSVAIIGDLFVPHSATF